ncbi:hypothetical protein EVAR_92825_1 [Eumeta japonica]|uniref:Uncharacterized protein n=1 Tax=Eumeta variegata TaxID=151549 RepID=A0A4C1TAW0_EUMVA|nr:hypothetical protein EVAR_92825_1 [Eumeta japonica]
MGLGFNKNWDLEGERSRQTHSSTNAVTGIRLCDLGARRRQSEFQFCCTASEPNKTKYHVDGAMAFIIPHSFSLGKCCDRAPPSTQKSANARFSSKSVVSGYRWFTEIVIRKVDPLVRSSVTRPSIRHKIPCTGTSTSIGRYTYGVKSHRVLTYTTAGGAGAARSEVGGPTA